MRYWVLLALLALGCDSTSPPDYDDVSGAYSGSMAGVSGGWSVEGTMTLSIVQDEGDLEGTASMVGEVSYRDVTSSPFAGQATFTGTIAEGRDPEVEMHLAPVDTRCGSDATPYTGRHDSEDGVLTLSGGFSMVADNDCHVLFSTVLTLSLRTGA